MKEKKEKSPKTNVEKEKFGTKFINTIKKRWIISGTNTILLIAILIAIVILINSVVQSLDLTPIDCTSNKEYTLTKESKERIENIDADVNIYFVGYDDSATQVSLAKQYSKANKKINVEVIDVNERPDIASKYNVTSDTKTIIIENGDKSRTLYSDDLYTYDSSYQTVDITEEKLTSAILNVTSDKIANVYFLSGYSDYSLEYSGGMYYLAAELTTNEITKYINNGGKILWLNSSYTSSKDLPNVNKILALYGIKPFEVGYIYETDSTRTVLGYASCIVEDLGSTDIAKKLTDVVLSGATKINIDKDALSDLGVTEEDIISTTSTSYFRSNISNTSSSPDGDEKGGFTIGGIFNKTISSDEDSDDKKESKLVIFGDNNFVSDIQITNQVNPMIFLGNNKDLMLNSIAYLTNNDQDITIRKDYTQTTSFTPTDAQKLTIVRIIYMVPIAIILVGFIVWQVRRRKK